MFFFSPSFISLDEDLWQLYSKGVYVFDVWSIYNQWHE